MNTARILSNPAQLRALTTLTLPEFEHLLAAFEPAFRRRRKGYKYSGRRRSKPLSPRRLAAAPKSLPTAADRLLFVLLALKTDAIQQHLAATFDLPQTSVSRWYRFLLPVLDDALARLGHRPARTLAELNTRLHDSSSEHGDEGVGGRRDPGSDSQRSPEAAEARQPRPSLHMDVTERRIPRSHDYHAQREDYNGKHRHHAVKNTVVADGGQRVVYLGPTWRGAPHDKRMADEELPDLSPLQRFGTWLTLDAGYLGYRPRGVHLLWSKRARRGHPLTDVDRAWNRWVGGVRIVVEHAIGGIKRLAKATRTRLIDNSRADRLIVVAAGLHNLRVAHRPHTYANSHARTQARLHPFGG